MKKNVLLHLDINYINYTYLNENNKQIEEKTIYDIEVKELKQERCMSALSYIEYIGDFNIDDYIGNDSLKKSWKMILKTLNEMSDEEIEKINYTENNII